MPEVIKQKVDCYLVRNHGEWVRIFLQEGIREPSWH